MASKKIQRGDNGKEDEESTEVGDFENALDELPDSEEANEEIERLMTNLVSLETELVEKEIHIENLEQTIKNLKDQAKKDKVKIDQQTAFIQLYKEGKMVFEIPEKTRQNIEIKIKNIMDTDARYECENPMLAKELAETHPETGVPYEKSKLPFMFNVEGNELEYWIWSIMRDNFDKNYRPPNSVAMPLIKHRKSIKPGTKKLFTGEQLPAKVFVEEISTDAAIKLVSLIKTKKDQATLKKADPIKN